jgi:glyoxylase I family protein
MTNTAFAHVGLNCRDMAVTERFYVDHFGFHRARVVPLGQGRQIVFLRAENVWLELFQAEGDVAPVEADGPAAPGFRHIAFQVDSVEAKIRELGSAVEMTLGPLHFDDFICGWAGAWMKDPDGRIIELSEGYKDEEELGERRRDKEDRPPVGN